ncbi:hypothetical protein BS17DRAFT_699205 [Gyrodon lividus]|nr:hypothetical protein BS17DRAFT_699205 [Gyrodon lividus]
MVYWRISSNMSKCAIQLWDLGWELGDICFALGMSSHSCYHWQKILVEHCSVIRPPNPLTGQAQIVMRAILTAMEGLFHEEPDFYLDELCTWLAVEHNIIISSATLSHTLNATGLNCKIMQKIAAKWDNSLWLMKQARTSKHLHDAMVRHCIVSDHSSKMSLCKETATPNGYLATQVVEGSYDSLQFHDFISEVLPLMNPFLGEHPVFVLDNCHIHHNEALVELVESAGE